MSGFDQQQAQHLVAFFTDPSMIVGGPGLVGPGHEGEICRYLRRGAKPLRIIQDSYILYSLQLTGHIFRKPFSAFHAVPCVPGVAFDTHGVGESSSHCNRL